MTNYSLIEYKYRVGAGKSSLLYSIIGEMLQLNKQCGSNSAEVEIVGNIGFVSQKPWIQNATLKDNVLFQKEFNEFKYQQCLKYACLEQDINVFQYGDKTMIGEKGINLSGG